MFDLTQYSKVLIVRLTTNGLPGLNKTDKQETRKLVDDNSTTKRHARVTKKLFADSKLADKIAKLASQARVDLKASSLPAEIDGKYLLPAALFVQIAKALNDYESSYYKAIDDFCANLQTEISSDMQSKHGLAKASDYPTVAQIRAHAGFSWGFEPLPSSSTFDQIFDSSAIVEELAEKHENHLQNLFANANQVNLDRLVDKIESAIASLRHYTGAKKQRLHSASILAGLVDQAKLSLSLNVANDNKIATMANDLTVICGKIIDHETLKQASIKSGFVSELVSILPIEEKPIEEKPIEEKPIQTVAIEELAIVASEPIENPAPALALDSFDF